MPDHVPRQSPDAGGEFASIRLFVLALTTEITHYALTPPRVHTRELLIDHQSINHARFTLDSDHVCATIARNSGKFARNLLILRDINSNLLAFFSSINPIAQFAHLVLRPSGRLCNTFKSYPLPVHIEHNPGFRG